MRSVSLLTNLFCYSSLSSHAGHCYACMQGTTVHAGHCYHHQRSGHSNPAMQTTPMARQGTHFGISSSAAADGAGKFPYCGADAVVGMEAAVTGSRTYPSGSVGQIQHKHKMKCETQQLVSKQYVGSRKCKSNMLPTWFLTTCSSPTPIYTGPLVPNKSGLPRGVVFDEGDKATLSIRLRGLTVRRDPKRATQ